MLPSDPNEVFLRNNSANRFWRRYGLFLYWFACAAIILLMPKGIGAPAWFRTIFEGLPAISSVLSAADGGKVAAWLLASAALYPVFHFSMRSRVYADTPQQLLLLKGVLAILVMDAVLLAALSLDMGSLPTRGLAAAWKRVIVSSDMGLAFAAPLISMVYSLAFFMTIHVVLVVKSHLAKER